MQALKISLYLIAFVLANLIVFWFGSKGLIITALFLIPFDFVIRCLFHEQWKGIKLIINLGLLVCASSLITYTINYNTKNIALGSVSGFVAAQIAAGLFYQANIKRSYFVKVNGSDAIGIIFDSIVFQYVAFSLINPAITLSQVLLKITGGFFWYYIIFVKYKLQNKWL